jgi:hypothetical protein
MSQISLFHYFHGVSDVGIRFSDIGKASPDSPEDQDVLIRRRTSTMERPGTFHAKHG